nr:MAG: DNA pilot protein [Microviridae sp.]
MQITGNIGTVGDLSTLEGKSLPTWGSSYTTSDMDQLSQRNLATALGLFGVGSLFVGGAGLAGLGSLSALGTTGMGAAATFGGGSMGLQDIGSIIGGVGSLGNLGSNIASNVINYESMRNNLAYQQQLQQQIFSREDTAVQRRVADLIAAGLSPTLAAGSAAGAGSVISTTAPKLESSQLDLSSMLTAINAMKGQADITLTQAQTELAKFQMEKAKADTNKIVSETGEQDFDNALMRFLGYNPRHAGQVGQIVSAGSGAAKKWLEEQKGNYKQIVDKLGGFWDTYTKWNPLQKLVPQ